MEVHIEHITINLFDDMHEISRSEIVTFLVSFDLVFVKEKTTDTLSEVTRQFKLIVYIEQYWLHITIWQQTMHVNKQWMRTNKMIVFSNCSVTLIFSTVIFHLHARHRENLRFYQFKTALSFFHFYFFAHDRFDLFCTVFLCLSHLWLTIYKIVGRYC